MRAGYPGDLNLTLARVKTSAMASGTTPVATAGEFLLDLSTCSADCCPGISVKNIVSYIVEKKVDILKTFHLYAAVAPTKQAGSLLLKINFTPAGASKPIGSTAPPPVKAPLAEAPQLAPAAAPELAPAVATTPLQAPEMAEEEGSSINLGEHAVVESEESSARHVTFVQAHAEAAAPPILALAAAGVALLGLVGLLLAGGGKGKVPVKAPSAAVKGKK